MLNPRQMEKLMKNIKKEEIDAKRVIIELEEGDIIIENPSVVKINIQGISSFQITGNERFEEKVNEEDVKLVMEQANVSREEAVKALKEAGGDIAEAILKLKGD